MLQCCFRVSACNKSGQLPYSAVRNITSGRHVSTFCWTRVAGFTKRKAVRCSRTGICIVQRSGAIADSSRITRYCESVEESLRRFCTRPALRRSEEQTLSREMLLYSLNYCQSRGAMFLPRNLRAIIEKDSQIMNRNKRMTRGKHALHHCFNLSRGPTKQCQVFHLASIVLRLNAEKGLATANPYALIIDKRRLCGSLSWQQ